MFDMIPTPQFEEDIRAAVATPLPRAEFIHSLHVQIVRQAAVRSRRKALTLSRLAWVSICLLVLLLAGILIVGPQRVAAAMRSLFGYIPGVGIVDQNAPIRVLAEPVSVNRDGISITVTAATLTGDKTHIEYRIFGVPGSAYPSQEDVMGCTTPEFLRLPDGTRLERYGNDFEPVPGGVDAATFVIPCILDTLPGKTPENWELPLRFIPAPPDLTVMPVIELSPSPETGQIPSATAQSANVNATSETNTGDGPASPTNSAVTVSKVIETSDGYILVGLFQPQIPPREQFQQTGAVEIHDASGKKVSYTFPQDIQPEVGNPDQGVYGWAFQFKAAGLAYPLTITIPGVAIKPADPSATAEFTFDAGPNPQPGQEWTSGQEIQLAGHTLKVARIAVDSRNGYSFTFNAEPQVFKADLQIEGYTPIGGGGGLTDGQFYASLSFAQLPTGMLKVRLSNLAVIGDPVVWQGEWSPETPRTDLPANPTPQPGLCLTTDAIQQLQAIPPALSNGKILVYEETETGKWGLVLYSLDGRNKQVVTTDGNWGALSPDGSKVAYSAMDNGIHHVDLNSMDDQAIPNASGFNIRWSPDGTQIAYIGMGNEAINSAFIAKIDGTMVHQVSNLSYETIIGWSPDSAQLYFAAPFTGGVAWKVYAYDIASGTTQERFTIENGTPKFLNPKLSADGEWIAYRGRDNSSVYLVQTDGSDMHLLLDNVGAVGVEWSSTGWLGVSLGSPDSSASPIVLLKQERCEAYLLPVVPHGDLEGLFIP